MAADRLSKVLGGLLMLWHCLSEFFRHLGHQFIYFHQARQDGLHLRLLSVEVVILWLLLDFWSDFLDGNLCPLVFFFVLRCHTKPLTDLTDNK